MNYHGEPNPYSQDPMLPPYVDPPRYPHPPQPIPPAPQAPDRRDDRGSKANTIIGLSLIGLVLVIIAAGSWWARQDDPDSAAVGDCVARDGADSVKVVDCTDPASAFKVVGKVDDKTQAQFSAGSGSICKPFKGAKSAFWKGESGGSGYVLCLAPVK